MSTSIPTEIDSLCAGGQELNKGTCIKERHNKAKYKHFSVYKRNEKNVEKKKIRKQWGNMWEKDDGSRAWLPPLLSLGRRVRNLHGPVWEHPM